MERDAVPHAIWLNVHAMAMSNIVMHVHRMEINSYTAIRAVMDACPTQLDAEGIHRLESLYYIHCTC